MADIAIPRNEKIECPFCKHGKIDIRITPEYYSYAVSRISAGSKRIPIFHPEKIEVFSKCSNCGKTRREIKEALESGSIKQLSHKERLKRLKEAGLPTKIEG